MLAYALKRLGLTILVGLAVSMIAFLLLRLSGDPALAIAGEGARAEDIALIRETYGFDRPIIVQYVEWLGRILSGDLGQSTYFKTPVAGILFDKLPTTIILSLASIVLALLIAIPLGVLAALYQGSLIDRFALAFAVAGQALPNFFFALLLIMFFSIHLRWLPVSGSGTWLHFIMPTLALGYYAAPAFMRLTRAGMVEVLASDYVRTARAKGLPTRTVVVKHGLRNALVPVVALTAVQLGLLLSGSIVIETVFALDGIGYLAFQSITHKDFPVTQAIVLFLSVVYVALTLLADLVNAWVDPRIRVA